MKGLTMKRWLAPLYVREAPTHIEFGAPIATTPTFGATAV